MALVNPVPPYPQREVMALQGVVAACDARAVDPALAVLKEGRNAADAAVVAGFLMMVYEPFSCGLGGHGGHMAFYDGKTGTYYGIDATTKAPAEASADMFEDELEHVPEFYGDIHHVKVRNQANALGFRAMFAPSTVAQYSFVLERFGTLTWAEAIAPAIEVAKEGFVADEIYTGRMNEHLRMLEDHGDHALIEPFRSTFFPKGGYLQVGQHITHPDMARTLERLAHEGPELFYQGEMADEIIAWVRKNGGILSKEDFTSYEVACAPLTVTSYRGYEIHGYPNCANGSTIANVLNMLDQRDLRGMGYLTPEALHTIIESMKLAFIDRYAYVSDRDFVPVPYDGIMSNAYGRTRANDIDPAAAQPPVPGSPWDYQASGDALYRRHDIEVAAYEASQFGRHADQDTTFMLAGDSDRNLMLITSSNFSNSKVVVPGLGFQLNNSMSGANPAPGHVLSIAPFKRILRNSGPTIVSKDGRPVLALSAPGGRKIITGTIMNILNVLDYGMGVQTALEAPRLHAEADGMSVLLEDAIPADTLARLSAMGHDLEVTEMYQAKYARMQAIKVDTTTGLYFGASEPRSHSGARGY